MRTKVFLEVFKGHPVFAIWEVNEAGEKVDPTKGPFFSFGLKKGAALVDHLDELKQWVESNVKAPPTVSAGGINIDMSKLSTNDQAALAAILGRAKS